MSVDRLAELQIDTQEQVLLAVDSAVAEVLKRFAACRGTDEHARLGVGLSLSDAVSDTQRGALIADVSADGAADKAVLKKGDLVTKVDDRVVDNADALKAAVFSHQPGDKVTITYIRAEETRTASVTLGSDAE